MTSRCLCATALWKPASLGYCLWCHHRSHAAFIPLSCNQQTTSHNQHSPTAQDLLPLPSPLVDSAAARGLGMISTVVPSSDQRRSGQTARSLFNSIYIHSNLVRLPTPSLLPVWGRKERRSSASSPRRRRGRCLCRFGRPHHSWRGHAPERPEYLDPPSSASWLPLTAPAWKLTFCILTKSVSLLWAAPKMTREPVNLVI